MSTKRSAKRKFKFNNMNTKNGIIYKPIADELPRAVIQPYHRTNREGWNKDLSKGAKRYDLRGIKTRDVNRVLTQNGRSYESKYRVGFEVEKNYFGLPLEGETASRSGSIVNNYALFRGLETDSSCGVEAITHILPLVPSGIWRTKVFNMMYEAKYILSDEFSGSDSRCGGHINLSVDGWSGARLMRAVREFSGVIHSLYRVRLYKTQWQYETQGLGDYCNGNMTMRAHQNTSDWTNAGRRSSVWSNRNQSYKYSYCKLGDNLIEFRVPPRVTSVECLMLRYQLFYELVDFAVRYENHVTPQIRRKFLKTIRPIILKMNNNDINKTRIIMNDAKHFQKYIDTDGEFRGAVIKAFIHPNTRADKERKKRWMRGEWR